MADVFISYSREDKARADHIAKALQNEGLDVFWDSEIPPGQTWADYVEEKLTQCKAVVVLWSEHSTKSQWVREEARIGRDKGKLIPVMVDATQVPFGFGEVQAADLSRWTGDTTDANWRRVTEAVRAAMTRQGASPQPRPHVSNTKGFQPPRGGQNAQPSPRKGLHPAVWAAIGGVATIALLIVIGMNVKDAGETNTKPGQPVYNQPAPQPVSPQPAAPQPVAQPQQQADYGQQLNAQMASVAQAMGSQGFQQVGAFNYGQLNAGASQDIPAQMVQGFEYRIAAVCDNDCGDIDLTLFDGYGNVISQDNANDDHPVVPVVVTSSGNFNVRATMAHCGAPPCYFAVGLFGRAAM